MPKTPDDRVKPVIRLDYRGIDPPQPHFGPDRYDAAVVAAFMLGLMICVPIIPGILAFAGGIAIRRNATRPRDRRLATAAALLGATNLLTYTVVVVYALL